MSGDLRVEYCLVENARRLSIGIETKQSGSCGRPTLLTLAAVPESLLFSLTVRVASLEVAISFLLLVVDIERENLNRRSLLLRGERFDCIDCHKSGTIAAVTFCIPIVRANAIDIGFI